ncbi:MAG: carboxypeptidase regulatory-like domain-containing protein [Elusimicrobia bacterium]|nr:carboxypeptidase regulatory-like domain-containing protein [Elusimicrobiota bacterium]
MSGRGCSPIALCRRALGPARRRGRPCSVASGAALAAGLGVSVMLTLSRVPASADFLLPRRSFYPFFAAFMRARQTPGLRFAVSWLALVLIVGAVGLVLWRIAAVHLEAHSAAAARRKTGWVPLAARLVGCLLIAAAARAALSAWLDVLQNAWFAPESLSPAEPVLALALASGTAFLAARACLAMGGQVLAGAGRSPSAEGGLAMGGQVLAGAGRSPSAEGGLALVDGGFPAVSGGGSRGSWKAAAVWCLSVLLCWFAAAAVAAGYGGRLTMALAAGIPAEPSGRLAVIVLTDDYEVRDVPLGVPGVADYSAESLAELERFGARRSVHRLAALRHACAGRALLGDADGMRKAAFESLQAGDPLAGLILLGNLARAPVSPANLAMLESLADEDRWRAGPHAAVALAAAYARFDKPQKAAYWLGRASQGSSAIPAGLLALPDADSRPAKVRGRLIAGAGLRVALYARDSAVPADLSPMALAASATTDGKGRFEFDGIGPGDYFLTVSFPAVKPASGIRVSGHRGDVRVAGKTVTLPPITLRW